MGVRTATRRANSKCVLLLDEINVVWGLFGFFVAWLVVFPQTIRTVGDDQHTQGPTDRDWRMQPARGWESGPGSG